MAARIITISDSIKQEIAERVVEQSHPGYNMDVQGEWFVVNGTRVENMQRTAPWAPWSDDADVISVDNLVFIFGGAHQDRADFDAGNYDDGDEVESAISFALGYVPDSYDAAEWEFQSADE